MKDFLIMGLSWFLFFCFQLIGIVSGYVVVPWMLLLGKWNKESEKQFTKYNTHRNWMREKFPKLFWPWDNVEDSSVGDHRGWWDANCFGGDAYKWFNRFWWLAVRNPFNNFKRYVMGCDVREYHFSKLGGQNYVRDDFNNTGWQLLKASPTSNSDKWLPRYGFYLVKRYGSSNRALVIQLGNKIKLEHEHSVEIDEIDYWKGYTFEINPFKDIS